MSRTPGQVAADETLTAAIEQAMAAYADDEEAWVLTEYVVLAAQTRYDDDGDQVNRVGTLYRDSAVPLQRALGLVEYAGARMRAAIMSDDE